MGQSREGVGHQFLNPLQGVGRASFSYPYEVGHPVFIMGIDTHLTQSTTKVTLFQQ